MIKRLVSTMDAEVYNAGGLSLFGSFAIYSIFSWGRLLVHVTGNQSPEPVNTGLGALTDGESPSMRGQPSIQCTRSRNNILPPGEALS